MAEYLDIVDENDVPVEVGERRLIHSEGLLHRAVHIFVFNSRGELFLQKRSAEKEEHPGKFDSSAAGHLESGEDYDDCARRELFEELGISVPLRKIAYIKACRDTGNEFVNFYDAVTDDKITINTDEIEYGLYLPLHEISDSLGHRPHDFTPAFSLMFHKYLEIMGL